MKKIIVALTTLIAFSSCQEQVKIGFVNNSELINEYKGKKDVESKYQLLDEKSQKKNDSLGRAYQLELSELQQKLSRMSEQQQQAAAQPFQQKWQLIDQQMKSEQDKFKTDFQTEIDSSITEVVDFVEEYAKTNGYSYIFGTSDASRSVMYGEESNDVTEEVLTALNSSYKKKK